MSEAIALRYARWLLNTALLTLCGFFVAQVTSALYEAFQLPPVELLAAPPDPAPPRPRTWSDREVILTRNLFNASLLAPVEPPPPPDEEVEETELPLGLLGTVSSPRSKRGWAAVWDAENRRELVVEPGDELGDGLATVVRIERERVLLSENGALRELVLDEDGQYRPPKRAPPRVKPRADKRKRRRRTTR